MNRDYIIGIYNMCDYWCDRCAFTRRCRNFETSERLANERGSTRTDEKNQEMWDSVDAVLAEARNRLDEMAEERFYDRMDMFADELSDEEIEQYQTEQDAHNREVTRHFVVKAADGYMRAVSAWLESAVQDVKDHSNLLLEQARYAPGAASAGIRPSRARRNTSMMKTGMTKTEDARLIWRIWPEW